MYPLTDQSCHTQAGTLNRKQTNNYKCFGSDADKYTWKHCMWTHTAKSSHVCTRTVSHMEGTHIHTHTHRSHFHTSMYTHFLCVASASFLPLHADCVSGIGVKVWSHTQAVRSAWLLHTLNGLYEWLGLND